MKILYVEDDPTDADLTRRLMHDAAPDFELDVVATQSEAIALLKKSEMLAMAMISGSGQPSAQKERPYDLVLADMRLPDGDGLSLLNYIREHSLSMAVVIITGVGDEDTAVSVLKAGADDYLIKRKDYIERLPFILEDALYRYRAESARHTRQLRVLYAEHNSGNIISTRDYFSRHTPYIHFDVVYNGIQVLSRLPLTGKPLDYDVILLDYSPFGFNALQTLKEIRQVRGLDVPVVLITGQGNEEVALQAIKLGASSYIIKNPGYLHQLSSELENAFYRAELIREHIELQKAQSDLAHVSRVMAMGELAASIAHEVNQPLCAIVANANTCLRWLAADSPDLEKVRAALQDVVNDGRRASEVISRIRTFVKKKPFQMVLLDINEIIQEVIKLTHAELEQAQVTLRLLLGQDLPQVQGDRVQLQQVILNLISNSLEAMRCISSQSRYLTIISEREATSEVLIQVHDTGIGLDQEEVDLIFNTFYTTKTEGMGMGLAIGRSIIEAHGGRLWATSNRTQGATFQFTLPVRGE